VSQDALIPVGAEIQADHFVVGQFVDVTGTSGRQGLAGGIKRWKFRRAARHPRCVGIASFDRFDRRTPGSGKTFKNKKMPVIWASIASPRSICGWCRPTSRAA